MRENKFKTIFFIIIIILFIISIYLAIKNKKSYANEETKIKKETQMENRINIGIIKFDTLNPILTKNQDIQYITKLIYKPLIDITQDFNLQNGIAEEWNKLDNKTYLIKLQENVLWDNGKKCTSQDIKYTIDFINQNQSIFKENVKNIKNIEIVNDYLIKIFLIEPEDFFEYMLCFPIICKEENVGTGNYKIESVDNNKIELKSNTNEINLIIYNSITKLYNAFSKGEVDFFITNNINYLKYIGRVGHNKNTITGRNFDYLKYNLKNKVLKNKEVIQAIELLINKNEINHKIFNNMYYTAEFPLQYGSYLYNNNIKCQNNINKAQKILEDTGWIYNR